jgi:hypothetical protein
MKFCLYLLTALISQCTFAQVASLYTFSQDTAPMAYNDTSATVLATGVVNDQIFLGNNIGFTFYYNNSSYTQFGLSTNGFIVLGDSSFMDTYYPISSLGADNVIAGLGYDLVLGTKFNATGTIGSNQLIISTSHSGLYAGATIQGNGILPGTTITAINGDTLTLSQNQTINGTWIFTQLGEISYVTTGIAPNRSCIIQWRSVSTGSSLYTDLNFQIILHETTGQVETVYDFKEKTATFWAQVGLRGNANSDFNTRTAIYNWQITQPSVNTTDAIRLSPLTLTVSGLRFKWNYALSSAPETNLQHIIRFYPNPATDKIIFGHEGLTEKVFVEVTDILGHIHIATQLAPNSASSELYIGDLPAGVYLIRLHTDKQMFTEQLIIQQ